MNSRISPLSQQGAQGEARELLQSIQSKFGAIPNIFRLMAHSPASLKSYLSFSDALSQGALPAAISERIAVLCAQENQCDYCLSAHSQIAKNLGLSQEEISLSRDAQSEDPRARAALQFARELLRNNGNISEEQWSNLRNEGFSNEEIIEIVANVSLNIFTNFFNNSLKTEVDFPRVNAKQQSLKN